MNIPTIIVALVVVIMLAAIFRRSYKRMKSGQCACGCDSCGMKGQCSVQTLESLQKKVAPSAVSGDRKD